MQSTETFRRAVRRAKVITLNIGGNDLLSCNYQEECLHEALLQYESNWGQILREIRLLNPRADLLTMTLYNPVRQGDIRRPPIEAFINSANAIVMNQRLLEAYRVTGVAQVHTAFEGEECSFTWYCIIGDIHPTDAGHQAIADALEAAYFPPSEEGAAS